MWRLSGLALMVSFHGTTWCGAIAAKTTLWPYAILLAILVLSLVAGWLIYGEHGGRSGDRSGARA